MSEGKSHPISNQRADSHTVFSLMSDVLKLYREGVIQPISPTTIFEAGEVEQAFRHLQQGNHIGKAVVRINKNSLPVLSTSPTLSPPVFDRDAAYLLTGAWAAWEDLLQRGWPKMAHGT